MIKINSQSLKSLSDEFNDEKTIGNWEKFSKTEKWPDRIEKLEIGKEVKGNLNFVPLFGGWWEGFHGSYIYKEVTGDFLVITKVKVKGKKTSLPTVSWNRGGILIRTPGDIKIIPENRKENFVHIMTGVNGQKNFVIYTGSTKENSYQWKDYPEAEQKESIYVELGILRIKDVVITFSKKENSQEWKINSRFFRGDLPQTLQVGLTGCAEPYDKTGNWLNSKYNYYNYNKEVLPSEYPADVNMFVDYFKFYDANLNEKDKNSISENSFTDKKLIEIINLLIK